MVTKLSTFEPPVRKHSIWEDLGIRLDSAWLPFFVLIVWPLSVFLGLLPAHLPYLFWPQYEAGGAASPIWFELLVGGLLLGLPLLLAGFGLNAARRAIEHGHRSAWLPAAGFSAIFAYAIWALISTLLS